jgi:hypothetical protein
MTTTVIRVNKMVVIISFIVARVAKPRTLRGGEGGIADYVLLISTVLEASFCARLRYADQGSYLSYQEEKRPYLMTRPPLSWRRPYEVTRTLHLYLRSGVPNGSCRLRVLTSEHIRQANASANYATR